MFPNKIQCHMDLYLYYRIQMYVLCVMPPHVHILCIRTRTISIKQRTLLFKRSSIHNRVDKIDSDFTIFEGIIMCQREEKNFFFLLILSF